MHPRQLRPRVDPASRKSRLVYLGLALANRLFPKVKGKVVLYSSIDLEDGVIAVIDELRSRGWSASVLLEVGARGPLLSSLTRETVRTVPKWSVHGMLHFLTARYVVITENVFGGYRPPPTQVVVNIWHGEPMSKVTGRFAGRGGLHASYAPVCSTVARAYRSAEFDIHPLRVPIIGAPRNDRMLRTDSTKARRALLGDDGDRSVFFWLPSFRVGRVTRLRVDSSDSHPGVPFAAEDVHRLDEWLTQRGARVVVKLHPHDLTSFGGDYRAISLLAQGELEQRGLTLYTALPAFDGLITDMSSVWVDYLLLDKPMIFAFPDVENYRRGRGLNLEPYERWVPGPFARSMDDLISALEDLVDGHDPMAHERTLARQRFHHFSDDQSTARLLDGLGIAARQSSVPS